MPHAEAGFDSDALISTLHFQFGDSGLLDYMNQFFDFFNRHLFPSCSN
jgi:hypothetical protein